MQIRHFFPAVSLLFYMTVGAMAGGCSNLSVSFATSPLFLSVRHKFLRPNQEPEFLQMAASIGQKVPDAMSDCFASIDLSAQLYRLKPIVQAPVCLALQNYVVKSSEMVFLWRKMKFFQLRLKKAADLKESFAAWEEFLDWLKSVKSTSFSSFCDQFFVHFLGCFDQFVKPNLEKIFQATECCADMKVMAEEIFHAKTLLSFISEFMHLLGGVMCDSQKAGLGAIESKIPCGYTALHSYITTEKTNMEENVIPMLQKSFNVPNDAGCAAFEGQKFKPVTGDGEIDIGFVPHLTLSGCALPWDKFLTFISKVPLLEAMEFGKDVTAVDLFAKGKSVPLNAILAAFNDDGNTVESSSGSSETKSPATNSELGDLFPALHFANGFSLKGECAFRVNATAFSPRKIEHHRATLKPERNITEAPSTAPTNFASVFLTILTITSVTWLL